MEKTYKRVPFDIELAKKIQSGEVEGRIVTKDGRPVRAICYDAENEYPLVCLVKGRLCEGVHSYRLDGCYGYDTSDLDLVIELPEEAPKQQCGDMCGDNRFEIIEKAKKAILEETNIDTRPEEIAVLDSFLFRCWQMGWLKKYDKTLPDAPKHEFKPFDKVLVRDDDTVTWFPNFFARYIPNNNGYPYKTIGGAEWKYCIPYEGNEHLVGTTHNPE